MSYKWREGRSDKERWGGREKGTHKETHVNMWTYM